MRMLGKRQLMLMALGAMLGIGLVLSNGCSNSSVEQSTRIESNSGTSRTGRPDADQLDKNLVRDVREQNRETLDGRGRIPADYVPSQEDLAWAAQVMRSQYRGLSPEDAAKLAETPDQVLLENAARLNGITVAELVYAMKQQGGVGQ